MVFEKKQLSKVLAIALMVACAVAFMPLLNGQVFAAKKPGKAKITSLEQADTANDDGTYAVTVAYKAKKAKKYQVSYTDGTEAKTMKTKKKSVSFNGTVDSTYTVKVRGIKGKKKGKWSAAQEIKVEAKTPGPTGKMEVLAVAQSGAKQLKVTFGTAVDPAGLVFTVNKDGKPVTATAKADPADPNSVLLDLENAIVDGSAYTVDVATADGTAVPTAAGAQTDVTGAKEEVSAIEFDEYLVLRSRADNATADIEYVIKNQFGEDVTAKYDADTEITAAIGSSNTKGDKAGKYVVNNIPATQQVAGTTATIVGVYKKTGINTTATVKIGEPAVINEIEFKGVYDTDKKVEATIVANGKNPKNTAIVFALKNQYGKAIEDEDGSNLTYNVIGGLTNVAASGTALGTVEIDDVAYYTIPLTLGTTANPLKAGDVTAMLVGNKSGVKGEYKFTVGDENTITSLTITAPDQVIGWEKNIFTVDAKNGAGVAITDYALLSKGIVLPTSDKGTWSWKKLSDGSGQLIYAANKVAPSAIGYDLQSASFSAKDTPTATSFLTFNVLPGKGIPTEIKDFKVETIDGDVEGETATQLGAITYLDKFGNELKASADFDTTEGYGAGTYEIQVALSEKAKNMILYNGTEVVPSSGVVVPYDYDMSNFKVKPSELEAGKSATSNVTLSLYHTNRTQYPNVINEKSKAVTVTNGVKSENYESYGVEVVYDEFADNVKDIYVGAIKDGEWEDYEAMDDRYIFPINVYGMIGNNKYQLDDYVIEDTADLLVEGADGYDYALFLDPQKLSGVTSDTLTVKVPGVDSAVTTTVNFSNEAPKASSLIPAKEFELEKYDLTFTDPISALGVQEALTGITAVRDQYGVPFNSGKMSVTLKEVTDDYENHVDAAYDDTTTNYVNPYNGTSFKLMPGDATADDAQVLTAGYTIEVEVVLGDIAETIQMLLVD